MNLSADWVEFFQQRFLNNTFEKWTYAFIAFFAVYSITRLIKALTSYHLKNLADKTETKIDDLLVSLLNSTKSIFYLSLAIYSGGQFLTLHYKVDKFFHASIVLILFLQVGTWLHRAITFYLHEFSQNNDDGAKATTIRAISFFGQVLVWTTITLLALENFGIDVTTLITGLGIGGIAIALAVQNVLGDALASLSILLDKPFVVGDTINVDKDAGTVEHIGLKTTRLKSDTGEQLIFSNSDLLKSRIRNFKRMSDRRVSFSIGILYETPVEKVQQTRDLIRNTIDSVNGVRFDRCHLARFADSALEFDVVYWVDSPEYKEYSDRHHEICIALLETFQKENIGFAYPTRKIFMETSKS